jgi:hypothetical protein
MYHKRFLPSDTVALLTWKVRRITLHRNSSTAATVVVEIAKLKAKPTRCGVPRNNYGESAA